ncbi:hypothetical protein F4560_004942 [Saccharothrix ecbatanensis]|jgi:hypothetical protein|uniref:Uncharacterized protein n=1 Tax=Saccharothrix ecbatanensis TaxID=1105145 RepID=A0A7W9HMT2_9PSEU|nr:hypothetical protein [Saccharothrix ecbatanensis]MBB5805174.1 hypothetical protein [Saccharothrix ecbatanensis]
MNHNEEPAKSRRQFTERLACTLVFTAVQLWAAVVIVFKADVDGVVGLAIALVLSGGLIAVHDAWRDVRSVRRELDVEIREDLVRL